VLEEGEHLRPDCEPAGETMAHKIQFGQVVQRHVG
jgi:hypothetical protein